MEENTQEWIKFNLWTLFKKFEVVWTFSRLCSTYFCFYPTYNFLGLLKNSQSKIKCTVK